MAVLNPDKDIAELLDYLEKSQWIFIPDFVSLLGVKIMTRSDLRSIEMNNDVDTSKTSGSTGEPVSVGKSYKDYIFKRLNESWDSPDLWFSQVFAKFSMGIVKKELAYQTIGMSMLDNCVKGETR